MCSLCGCWLETGSGEGELPSPLSCCPGEGPKSSTGAKKQRPSPAWGLPGSAGCLSVRGVCLSWGLQLLWLPLPGLGCSSDLRGGCAVPPALQGRPQRCHPIPSEVLLPRAGGPWGCQGRAAGGTAGASLAALPPPCLGHPQRGSCSCSEVFSPWMMMMMMMIIIIIILSQCFTSLNVFEWGKTIF